MPQQLNASVENNFTKGLITESTGLNFPENAATSADNCEFTLIGDVNRRLGYDYELNYTTAAADVANKAINSYKWDNAGGDGLTQVVVKQIGKTLYFYRSSTATIDSPLSTQILPSTVNISSFAVTTFDETLECGFADGNGYLFVYHPNCDPFYCTYTAGVIAAKVITVQIRDFVGALEASSNISNRPAILTKEHTYNLVNQGWTLGSAWNAFATDTVAISTGLASFYVGPGLPILLNDLAQIEVLDLPGDIYGGASIATTGTIVMSGVVTGYTPLGTLTVNVTADDPATHGRAWSNWVIYPANHGYIKNWNTALGNYPSNADVWWYFKDSTGAFAPITTFNNIALGTGPAPKGHSILNAFSQQRSLVSGVAGINNVVTSVRPKTGCWFQGRVWYTGVDASQPAVGNVDYTTWSEDLYFSQIVKTPDDFGHCYQLNDPTSENLFNLLPTDGGVIKIQGCGSIYKLFPLMNALLVFAANGVWYITGSTGIGFTASDYTIVKLSSVKSISTTSFVDVQGLPMFWNEEGIYKVEPAKQGQGLLSSPLHVNPLEVAPVTLGTILSFYNQIPLSSKKYARGAYFPADYILQWVYRDTEATDVTSRYQYNKILNYNNSNNAFFPYTVSTGAGLPTVNGILYVQGPGGSTSPAPVFKYLVNTSNLTNTFAEENDDTFVDWASVAPTLYDSHFVTGYKLRGQAIKKFQPQYVQVYSRTNGASSAYKLQGIWNYANDPDSGKWSTAQIVHNDSVQYDTIFRRHKIRGSGYALQFKVTSVDSQPFDIQGWAVVDTVNQAA